MNEAIAVTNEDLDWQESTDLFVPIRNWHSFLRSILLGNWSRAAVQAIEG